MEPSAFCLFLMPSLGVLAPGLHTLLTHRYLRGLGNSLSNNGIFTGGTYWGLLMVLLPHHSHGFLPHSYKDVWCRHPASFLSLGSYVEGRKVLLLLLIVVPGAVLGTTDGYP